MAKQRQLMFEDEFLNYLTYVMGRPIRYYEVSSYCDNGKAYITKDGSMMAGFLFHKTHYNTYILNQIIEQVLNEECK